MNKFILIKNGRVIDTARRIDETASIAVSGGKIVWYGKRNSIIPAGDREEIDAEGMTVCTGFIDMHCHLREPGYTEKETIVTGTRAAARGGFTNIYCMPNTDPPLDDASTITGIKQMISDRAVVGVLPVGCVSQGRKGLRIVDMDGMVAAGAAGFSDDGAPVISEEVISEALRKSIKLDVPIIEHCEDPAVMGKWDINSGTVAERLHLRGMPPGAEESVIERDLALNKKIGGKLHLTHVSTGDSVALIRKARRNGVRVTADVTPHHLTLDEDRVLRSGTNAKVSPPLRTRRDMEALLEGLQDGTIDAIATDHAPHTPADKDKPFAEAAFGISGFETALGSLLKLVDSYKLPLNMIVEKLTSSPAALLGKRLTPSVLAEDAAANIVIFDQEVEWVVDTGGFVSKGKNTPLAGEKLKGKVVLTMYRGNVVYRQNT